MPRTKLSKVPAKLTSKLSRLAGSLSATHSASSTTVKQLSQVCDNGICEKCRDMVIAWLGSGRSDVLRSTLEYQHIIDHSPTCTVCFALHEELVTEAVRGRSSPVDASGNVAIYAGSYGSSHPAWPSWLKTRFCYLYLGLGEGRLDHYLNRLKFAFGRYSLLRPLRVPEIADHGSNPEDRLVHANYVLSQTSQTSFDIILRQMKHCRIHHRECSIAHDASNGIGPSPRAADLTHSAIMATQFRPTRLLEIGTSTKQLRLIDTSNDKTYAYATLSHCWGKEPFTTLTTGNKTQFLQNIPVSSLTQTFSDTVMFCKWAHIKYLWIDSLCIVQDDPLDCSKEIRIMGEVYANSFLNIAASAAHNGMEGLFRPCKPTASALCRIKRHAYLQRLFDYYVLRDGALASRGWVLQEAILSVRTIHFTSYGAFWQCRRGLFLPELDTVKIRTALLLKIDLLSMATSQQLDIAWTSLAEEYSRTTVSFPSDRAFAIAGLAERFQSRYTQLGTNTRYIAGCWTHNIPVCLSWKTKPIASLPRVIDYAVAPAWSWLSASSETCFTAILESPGKFPNRIVMRLEGDDVKLRDSANPAGPLEHGRLLLRSLWCEARVEIGTRDLIQELPDQTTASTYISPCLFLVYWDPGYEPGDEDNSYIILAAAFESSGYFVGLVCKSRTNVAEDGVQELERHGSFSCWESRFEHGIDRFLCPQRLFWLV